MPSSEPRRETMNVLIGSLLFAAGLVLGAALILIARRRPLTDPAAEATDPAWRAIAVPIVNGGMPRAALSVAARLSRATRGKVVVLTVVQIPRAVGLDAQSPPGLEAALTRLETAEGIVRGLGAQVQGEIVRVRELGDAIGRACRESGAEAVVLKPDATSRATAELLHALIEGRSTRDSDLVLAHSRAARE